VVEVPADNHVAFDFSKTQNISSDEIENSEVDKIAEELRHRLKGASKSDANVATPLPTPPEPAPVVEVAPPTPPMATPLPEGEITIDHDGNLSQSA